LTSDVTSNHTSKPHIPPSKPHIPPLVSDTYPNNNKLNNTKEQEEGTRIISSSFNKKDGPTLEDRYPNWPKKRKTKNAGVNRINSDDPDKYIKGKYGHMVQR